MNETMIETIRPGTGRVATELAFYFDPLCPWAWRTSKWIREVQGQTGLQVTWKPFSLAEANGMNDPDSYIPIRMVVLAEREGGNDAVERLYDVLGRAMHEQDVDIREPGVFRQALQDALAEAGLDPTLLARALDDPSTLDEAKNANQRATEEYGAYGVPWLVIGDAPFGFNGPVMDNVPEGDTALQLWQHISWLLTQPYFYEIKRNR
jgi:2-hydroxychromene-2-carboxylate isomerase